MKIQILQEDLNKGLVLASRMTASRGQLPILSNVLLTARKEGLQIAATNLEIGVRINIGGKVSEIGSTTVVAKSLAEFVNSLPSGSLVLETEGDKLKVTTNHSSASFSGISATEFPALPESTTGQTGLVLTNEQIRDIAVSVAFAAATDESRPILTGIQFKPVLEKVGVFATDGFRMSRLFVSTTNNQLSAQLILPARTLIELAKLVQTSEQKEVTMQLVSASNQVIFSVGEIDLISRILEGNFPDVNKIIPLDSSTTLIIDREDLFKSVRTASIFARENSNIIKIKVQDTKITVSAVAANLGENESEVEAEVEGEGGEISFNCKFVLDFLGSVTSERIVLKTSGAMAPGIFMPEGNEDLVHLIMPVRVAS